MTEMEHQQEAVRVLLVGLFNEGIDWRRNAKLEEDDPFESDDFANYSVLGDYEIHEIGRKPAGAFPKRKILLTKPYTKEKSAVVGFWLRWDFEKHPHEFRLFLGFWFQANGERIFNGYRFDAPETGEEHDYFHCQPCRNFGDKESLVEAAPVSERFPTIPINASNVVELTVCGLMAVLGRTEMKRFLSEIMKSSGAGNEFLTAAYSRCVKNS